MEICEKFCIFWINLKHMGSLSHRGNILGVIGRRVIRKKGVLRTLHSLPLKMGVPPGFISYYNLNFIKYLLVISVFATLAGRHMCIKKHLMCPTALSKSSKFWFLLVSMFKATTLKLIDWLKRFSFTSCPR